MINFTTRTHHFIAQIQHRSRKLMILVVASIVMLLYALPLEAQFLRRSGKQIVDADGQEFILRGIGLGGWMLQEGYMLEMNSFANPQHQIRARIEELIGTASTDEFYEAWYANHCTKPDIDSLKSWGFNSVRLPMHYNLFTLPIEDEPVPGQHTWLEKGFAMTDSLVKWCAANSMYVILDLHAAPGGQGRDAAISDYDASKPSLWESEANRQKTIALWRKLAERYANEKWIAGYDIINETNWNFTEGKHPNGCEETSNGPLRQLFVEITNAIREVDTNHIIFIEGNCWANNHAGLFPAWDNNLAISFHKYWNFNDAGSVQGMINLRNQHNLPLWMGESGENSNTWFTGAIELLEKNGIGWAWWPMKKVGSVVGPLTITRSDGYNTLLNYWKNGGTKPSVEFARNALMQLAEDLKIENNTYHKDVIDAMFRQVKETTTIPFAKHNLPGIVQLSDYDLGRHGKAYADKDTATHHVSVGDYTAWNNGWVYRNDGVDIQESADTSPLSNRYNVGWTADGEWMRYTVNVDSTAAYKATIRYAAAANGARVRLLADGNDKTGSIELPSTGGNQTWADKVVNDVLFTKGINSIQLLIEKGGANLGFMQFEFSKKYSETPFTALRGETNSSGTWIEINLNKQIKFPVSAAAGDFVANVNNTKRSIEAIETSDSNPFTIRLRVIGALTETDAITVSYTGTSIVANDDSPLQQFTDLAITNTLPVHIAIPGKLEAENFIKNVGLQLETTTDAGGGQNIGYTNAGDYLEYRVRVAQTTEYHLELRIASAGAAGLLEVQQLDENGAILNARQFEIPVTGGWQTWKTITGSIPLESGSGILRLRIIRPEFNLNWIRFSPLIINDVEKPRQGSLHLYPNPADTMLRIQFPADRPHGDAQLVVRTVTGHVVKDIKARELSDVPLLYVGDLAGGLYILEILTREKSFMERFVKI